MNESMHRKSFYPLAISGLLPEITLWQKEFRSDSPAAVKHGTIEKFVPKRKFFKSDRGGGKTGFNPKDKVENFPKLGLHVSIRSIHTVTNDKLTINANQSDFKGLLSVVLHV